MKNRRKSRVRRLTVKRSNSRLASGKSKGRLLKSLIKRKNGRSNRKLRLKISIKSSKRGFNRNRI